MASNTTFNPTTTQDFTKNMLDFRAKGISARPEPGTTTNIDITMTDDSLLTGAWLVIDGATYGDYINFKIVDSTGQFSGTPGTVLKQPITTWYVPPTVSTQIEIQYPAKLYTNLTIRIEYVSVGETSPFIAINYNLHKVLY